MPYEALFLTGTVHIIGGGVAGLSSAVNLVAAGRKVVLFEATKAAGGRCRSFFDPTLETVVDNGSHAVLGANPAVFEYLDLIGSRKELVSINPAGDIPFVDLASNARWSLEPGTSKLPWWVFTPRRRAPETELSGYLRGLGLVFAGKDKAVTDILPATGRTYTRFWEPFITAVMNTDPADASAALLGKALRQTLSAKTGGFQTYVPKTNLAATFIEPALKFLSHHSAEIRYETAVKSVLGHTAAETINLRAATLELPQDDAVILAVPPWSPLARRFLRGSFAPQPSPIVNVHYKTDTLSTLPVMTGVMGGSAHWIFARDGLISVTVSAATPLASLSKSKIASIIWADVRKGFNIPTAEQPPFRVIIERRATPLQDCAFARSRPKPQTHLKNVFLAGDWLDTGLPCTLESAVISGKTAAKLALGQT